MIFLPFSVSDVTTSLSTLFSLDLTSLTPYESLVITLLSNMYFFGFWFFIIYFSLKGFNRVYERLF